MPGLTFNVFGHDVSGSTAIKGVEKQAGQSSGHMKAAFKEVGKTLVEAFAAEKLIEFGKSSFEAAEKLEKANKQTEAVLKSTGEAAGVSAKDIESLGSSISKKTGIDHVAIQSAENLLLTFQNVHNEVGKGNDIFTQATKVTTDLSVATGRDLRSATVLVGKALNDPIKGLTSLGRIGVTFTAGQKKQIKGFIDSGQAMKAQKLILEQLNQKFKGSAEAQATPAEKAKVAWTALKEQIGSGLLPVIGKLADFLTTKVIPALSAVVTWLGKNRDWLIPLIAAVGSIVLVLKAWAIAQAILNAVLAVNPIVLIAAAIIGLGVALVVAYKKSETFRDIVQGAFAGIKAVAAVVWPILKGIFGAFVTALKAIGDAAMFLWHNVISPAADGISTAFKGAAVGLKWVWSNVISPVFGWIKTGIGIVRDVVSRVASVISDAFKGVSEGLSTAWDFIGKVYGWIKTGIHDVYVIVQKVTGWIGKQWSRMIGPLKSVWNTISGVFTQITDGFNTTMDLLSGGGPYVPGIPNKGPGFNFPGLNLPGSTPQGHGTPKHNAQGTGFFPGGATWLNELGAELVTLPRGSKITTAGATASQDRMWNGRAVKQSVVNHNNITVINNNPQQERASTSTPAGLRTAQATFGGGRG